jgi:DDE superfamily endonuclease
MGALHAPESRKNASAEGAVIVFEDEASCRQTPPLHATWAKRGSQPQIPRRGERHPPKVFGAVRLDHAGFIDPHQENYFPGETDRAFLEQVVVPAFYRRHHRLCRMQDNASYHKKQEAYAWFKTNRRYLEVFQLPPYWPEWNATEGIWNYTRKHVTHHRFFEHPQDLCHALFSRFDYVRPHPQEIEELLSPFFNP